MGESLATEKLGVTGCLIYTSVTPRQNCKVVGGKLLVRVFFTDHVCIWVGVHMCIKDLIQGQQMLLDDGNIKHTQIYTLKLYINSLFSA